jgi:hypothetical protein
MTEQELMSQGISPDQLHSEPAPGVLPPEAMPQQEPVPPASPEMAAGQPEAPQVDDEAQRFYNEKMLSHMGAIGDRANSDEEFAQGLEKSNVSHELVSELAHWHKDRVIALLEDIIENPDLGREIHDAYQKSLFHGRDKIEQWREDRYHGEPERSSKPEQDGPDMPMGDEVDPNMDEEAGDSAMSDNEMDYVRAMSRKSR